jgi:AraC family transcriptional regulator
VSSSPPDVDERIREAAISRRGGLGVVLDYVENNLDQEIGLQELSQLVGFSVVHFARTFKVAYQLSPYQYVMRRRVERAKKLLTGSESTIASVAAHSGFASQSHFSQIFVRQTGMTPSAFRSGH